jgi:murein DD-endopeptidase MepM/ murein hydrolase activator NlpD
MHSLISRMTLLAVALGTLSSAAASAATLAPAFRWKSRVYLNNDFDSVSASDGEYTVVARFMPTYDRPHFGVIFAANGSNGHRLLLGQDTTGDFERGLTLVVDGTTAIQAVDTELKVGKWNYVAVTYKLGTGWRVILNGTQVISVPDGSFRPTGKMTIGNTSTYSKHNQFYGLIDDVAVFTKKLSSTTIASLMGAAELQANATDMKYGWSFNTSPTLTAASSTPTYGSNAASIGISSARSDSDKSRIPPPIQAMPYHLPIPVEYEAYVVMGNSTWHHAGSWAWAWDFIYAGKRSDSASSRAAYADHNKAGERNLAEGKGRKLVAVADGDVVQASWDVVEGDGNGVPNSVMIRHASGEYSSYFHLTTNSFPEFFPWPGSPITFPPSNFTAWDAEPIGTRFPVVANGEAVGGEGGTGMGDCADCYHLHYAVLDQPDIFDGPNAFPDRITKPIEFSDYEYSDDRVTWHSQSTGVPVEGQYVRRKAEPVVTNRPQRCGGFDLNEGMYPNQPIF